MGRFSEIDWNLVKFKYEILGYSLEELMEEYELTEAHAKYISKDWKQVPASERKNLTFTDLSSLEALTDEIATHIRSEAATLKTLKQKHLLPKYIELENILLSKAISLAQKLDADRSSATALNTLTNVLQNLIQHNPLLVEKNEEEGAGNTPSKEWKVTIVDARTDDTEKTDPVLPKTEKV